MQLNRYSKYGVQERRLSRFRGLSLFLVFAFLLQLIAPAAYAAPPSSSSQPTYKGEALHPAIEKLIPRAGRDLLNDSPVKQGIERLLPDPTRQLAQTISDESKGEDDSNSDKQDSDKPKRYQVPNWKPKPDGWDAWEPETKSEERSSSGTSNSNGKRQSPVGDDDSLRVDKSKNHHNHDDGHHSSGSALAIMQADPSGEPPFAFSRQPGKDGGFLDAASGTTYQNDWMVHSNRTFKQLTNNEEIAFDWVSPNPTANHTSRHTAASCVYRYRHVGKSPSSFDAQYRLEIKVYDAKSPNGRSIVRKQEAMQLCQLNAHCGVAARDLGKWTLNISRNGQNEGTQEFTVNEPLKPSDTGWTRVSQGQLKSASDLVGYTRDEALVYRGDYTIPEPEDGKQEQDFRVIWHLKAPESRYNRSKHRSFWSLESRYHWDGQRYSLKTTVFDQAYPNGRILKSEDGDGRLGSFRLCYGQGLPKFGNYTFSEKVDKAVQANQTLTIRQLDYSAKSLTAGLFLDNGKVPFELSFNSNPSDWVPSTLLWRLKLVSPGGTLVREYVGQFDNNTDQSKSWLQVWDGKDELGNQVKLGEQVQAVLEMVDLSSDSTAARRLSIRGAQPIIHHHDTSTPTPTAKSNSAPSSLDFSVQRAGFFTENPDGSIGQPGDQWQLSSVGPFIHRGRVVVSVNRPDNTPAEPTGGLPANIVLRGSSVIDPRNVDPFTYIFTIPTSLYGGYMRNIYVESEAANGRPSCFENSPIYLKNFRTGENFLLFADYSTQPQPPGSCISGYRYVFVPTSGGPNTAPLQNLPTTNNGGAPSVLVASCEQGAGDSDPLNYNSGKMDPLNMTANIGGAPIGYAGSGVTGGAPTGYYSPAVYKSPIGLTVARGSGRHYTGYSDIAVETRSSSLLVQRVYTSGFNASSDFSPWRWSFNDTLKVIPSAEVALHQTPSGHLDAFNGVDTFTPARGDMTDRLTKIDDRHFLLVTKSKLKVVYEVPTEITTDGISFTANISQVTDQNGNTQKYHWDGSGKRLLKLEGPDSSQFLNLTWSNDTGPDRVTDHTGRVVKYHYISTSKECNSKSALKLLTSVEYPGGKSYAYGYHSDLAQTRFTLLETRENGVLQEKLVSCDDKPEILNEVTHRDEATMAFSRDNSGVVPTTSFVKKGDRMPEGLSQSVVCELNPMDQVVKATDGLGYITSAVYDEKLNIIEMVDPKGNSVKMTYDDRRNPTSSTDSLGRVTTMVWNSDDVLTQVTDANGQATTMEYDSHFNLISVTDPLGHQSTMTYNSVGLPTSSTDPLGHTTNYEHDSRGFLRSKTAPASGDGNGPATWTYTVDSLGRTTQVTDPLGRVSKIRFDERSRVVESTIPAVTAQVRQGALNEAKVTASYDNNDLLLSTTSVDGLTTRYEYDLAHKLVAVYQPGKAKPTRLKYNSLEQVVEMTNPNGSVTKYEFDRISRLKSMTYPGGNVERYTYDANSNLTCWDRGQYQVKYTFDELDRLRVLDSPSTSDRIALDYDALDRVQTMTDNSGVTSYSYTNNYLLNQISRPGGKTLTYGFDNGDRLTSCTDSDGGQTQYSYTDRDELASVSRDGQTIRYQHDLVGRVTGVTYPNGVNCRHQFSERNQLLKREYLNGSNPLLTLKYSFNQVGQRILDERISPQGTIQRNFGYDSQRHLTNSRRTQGRDVSYHNYCFDDNDNITQKDGVNFTVNSDDQLKRAGTIQLGYNAAGQAVNVNPKNIRYSYNDQIKSVTSPGTSVTMLYDGAGQRVAKTVNGQTARYLWNGGEILKEYAPDGTTKAEYLLGMGREAIKVGGAWKFYLRDIQGSTLGLVDAQGHVTDTYEYSDYGDTISRTGNSYNPFQYTGQELDAELGMYHLRARHYSPSLGRFIARDPIGHAGGSNLYAYCSGDPIGNSDPSGLCETVKVTMTAKVRNAVLKALAERGIGGALAEEGIQWILLREAAKRESAGLLGGPIGETVATGLVIEFGAYIFGNVAGTLSAGSAPELLQVRTIQTGGNTLTQSAANALNSAHGKKLAAREWGRALEAMKEDLHLRNDFHQKIQSDGTVLNAGTGKVVGNILDYLK